MDIEELFEPIKRLINECES